MKGADLSYLEGLGRCSGALARAQALLCLVLSDRDGLRPFGGGLHRLVGMAGADQDTLLPAVTLEVARAVEYLNEENAPDRLEVEVKDAKIADGRITLSLHIEFNGESAVIETVA